MFSRRARFSPFTLTMESCLFSSSGTRAPSTIPAVASDKRDGEAEISMKEDDAINVAAERRLLRRLALRIMPVSYVASDNTVHIHPYISRVSDFLT
ncbi:uncharacterized protein BT62DRAFT_1010381 [Guyanagaster necrorhizus]|uniref:Uncharacterized protein n=1 Tax=Guyanagaster necrorhizus TaxID=856835 RepID=A0A9P7VKV4_9AGAR|nr:uncharacterized protein BT62DRAFT_1010381 [Guyanagaster necrorhizus MCA 3950]KAG7442433.1 hypothetical protein BT62DRAFT_1010381 [Guyanagaster necrorhizus MCA 3950]